MMINRQKYVIGVDAGGTKTQALLSDSYENTLAWGNSGPANPTRIPFAQARASLVEAVAKILRTSGLSANAVAAVCLGVAGGGKKEYQTKIAAAIAKLGIAGQIIVVSDVVTAFWSAIPTGRGIIAIAGTGSSAYGVDGQGNTVTAGGWGYLVGDEGSAFDIGRSGITAALKAYEGRGPATILQEHLLPYLHLNAFEEVRYAIYNPSDADRKLVISRFAPLVTQAAAAGDEMAQNILRRAGNEIGLNIVSVAQQLGLCGQAFKAGLIGGVFKAGDLVVNSLREVVLKTAPHANIFISHTPPSLGAARLALRTIERDDTT